MNNARCSLFDRFIYNLKTIIRVMVGHYYSLYALTIRGNYKEKKLLCSHDTDILIEGFPRVGNTFFVVAFEKLSQNKLNIAHHIHLTCQIKEALSYNKPIIVLVRYPIDAVVSLKIREPRISMHIALAWYLFFYSFVLKHQSSISVKDFASFIDDYTKLKINGFSFKSITVLNDNEIFNRINQINKYEESQKSNNKLAVNMPTKEKKERKRTLRKNFNSNTWLAQKCFKVYQELQELAE